MQDKNVVLLLWALPIALSVHVFEEFFLPGGLPQWLNARRLRNLTEKPRGNLRFFIINGVGIAGTLSLALWPDLRIYDCIVALMAANSVSHIRGTIQKRQYCPGTVSGTALFLPLFVVSNWYLLHAGKLDWLTVIVCVCVGSFLGFYWLSVHIRKADVAAYTSLEQPPRLQIRG